LARSNLLKLVCHHGTDSVRNLGLLCNNKMLRPVRIMVVNGTRSVFIMSVVSSHLLTTLALIPHGPVTIYSRTGTGPRPGICRPRSYHIKMRTVWQMWLLNLAQ